MAILDKGRETIRAWPSVERTDRYGTSERVPGDVHVDIDRVFMIPASATIRTDPKYSEDARAGQDAALLYTVLGRDLSALDPWAEIEWPVGSGRFFEVRGWPTHHTYPPRLAHYSARLAARGETVDG